MVMPSEQDCGMGIYISMSKERDLGMDMSMGLDVGMDLDLRL